LISQPTRSFDLLRSATPARDNEDTQKTSRAAWAQSVRSMPEQTRRKNRENALDNSTSFRDDTPMQVHVNCRRADPFLTTRLGRQCRAEANKKAPAHHP